MYKLWAVIFIFFLSTHASFADDLEILCPCTIETKSDTMVVASFKVARHFGNEDVVGLYVALRGNDSPRQFDNSDLISSSEFSDLPPLREQTDVRIEMPFRFNDRANTDLMIAELKANGSILPYKTRSLSTALRDASIKDQNVFASALAFREQIKLESSAERLSISLPQLVNLGETITDRLVLRFALVDQDDGSYYRLYEQEIADSLAKTQQIEKFSFSVPNNLEQYPESHSDLVVSVISLDQNGDPKFLMLEDTIAKRGALDEPLNNRYETAAVDFFTDTDQNGISDYNETILDLKADSVKELQKWQIKVSAIGTEEAAKYSTDLRTNVEHLINHTNNIFDLSGVKAELSLANFQTVGSANGAPIQGVQDSDPNQLDMLVNFESPFEVAQSYHEDNDTDVIIAFGQTATDDEACGVAQGWGSADANLYPAKSLSREYKHELFVVGIDCPDYVLAHEFGHVAGLGHSKRQGEMGIAAWSRGYGVDNEFVTVMAYRQEFEFAPKIELFSSVENTSCGTANVCGINRLTPFDGSDAVYTLNQTIPHLAALKRGYQPVVNLNGSTEVVQSINQPYVEYGATSTDFEDGDLTALIEIGGKVNTAELGTYVLTYSVKDTDGNVSRAQRTVLVSIDADFDSDGIPDNSDTDDDNDGIADINDAFPFDVSEFLDTDGDGIGNNSDKDDDNDGVADTDDAYPLDPTKSTIDSSEDLDGDGFTDQYELEFGSDPDDPTSIPIKSGVPPWLLELLTQKPSD